MQLLTALEIGEECGLNTVREAIYNIDLRAGQIFAYSEIEKELKQLYSEWNSVKDKTGFTAEYSIVEVMDWLKSTNTVV